VQTWFPLQIQVYLNGHEWLARKLTARGIEHTKIDNVFARIEDLPRAQRLAERCASVPKEVMNFLGRKLVGNFQGEVVSDLSPILLVAATNCT